MGEIFKQVLGPSRVVGVLGAQSANDWTAARGLDYLRSAQGGAGAIDAIAIAPYLSVMPDPAAAGRFHDMTVDALFDHVRSQVLPATVREMQKYSALARRHGLRLIAYEGGQHMVGVLGAENNQALNRLFDAFYTTKPSGLGMGLSISRSLVEAHDGQLCGVTNTGRGMTVYVALPVLGSQSH